MDPIIADLYGFECPHCGSEVSDLWDLGIPLIVGAEITCSRCHALFKIVQARGPLLTLIPTIEVARV